MKRSTFVLIVAPLCAFLIVFLTWYFRAETETASTSSTTKWGEPPLSEIHDTTRVQPETVIYYFHAARRCATCRKLEAYSIEAIEDGFPNELANGTMMIYVVNINKPENKHFVTDYDLFASALVISDVEENKQTKWKNLERVWELVLDKPAFVKYVQDEINDYVRQS